MNSDANSVRFPLEQIKIVMDINVPNESHKIPFTRDSIHYAKDPESSGKDSSSTSEILSYYPYFTYQVKYDKTVLSRMKYTDLINTFFSKREFERVFRYTDQHTPFSPKKNDDMDYDRMKREYISHNVHTMIELLFFTYPVPNNNEESYGNYILKNNLSKFSYKDVVPSFLQPYFQSVSSENSYIKINGRIFTVSKTVWLNDVLNHPVYRSDLIDGYKKFTSWRKTQILQNVKDNEQVLKDIVGLALKTRISPTFQTEFFESRKIVGPILDASFNAWYERKIRNNVEDPSAYSAGRRPVDYDALSESAQSAAIETKKQFKTLKRSTDINTIAYVLEYLHQRTNQGPFTDPDFGSIRDQIEEWYSNAFETNMEDRYQDVVKRIESNKVDVDPRSVVVKQDTIERNKTIDRLIALIKDFYTTQIYTINIPGDKIIIDPFVKLVDELKEVVALVTTNYRVPIPSEFSTIVEHVYKSTQLYKLNKVIQEKYFGETVRLFSDDENAEMKSLFEKKYAKFLEYGTKLKQFVPPLRTSSNILLQTMINEYLNSSSVALEHYLKQVEYMMKQSSLESVSWDESITDIRGYDPEDPLLPLYVGITEYSDQSIEHTKDDASASADTIQTKYEMYLAVDVIGGEVNRGKMANMVCRFRGETLGDMYTRLFRKKYAETNDWDLQLKRPQGFIDTTSWSEEATALPPVPPTGVPPVPPTGVPPVPPTGSDTKIGGNLKSITRRKHTSMPVRTKKKTTRTHRYPQ